MDEFKTQFQPAIMDIGSVRINEGYGRKHYVACFVARRRIVHQSRKQYKRSMDAREYGQVVLLRYRRGMEFAFLKFLESQDAEPVN